MSSRVIDLESYKNEEDRKLKEALECFEGLDLSLVNYTNIMEKLKGTKDSIMIKEIPINYLEIEKIAYKMNKKTNK